MAQALDLSTPLLLVTDRALLHAVRDAKVAANIAMPLVLLRKLPELLKGYTMRWDPKGALLAFSPEFKEGATLRRWKVVFTPWNAASEPRGPARLQLRFKTVTKVGEDAIGLGEDLP
jgi:hypothetical protein